MYRLISSLYWDAKSFDIICQGRLYYIWCARNFTFLKSKRYIVRKSLFQQPAIYWCMPHSNQLIKTRPQGEESSRNVFVKFILSLCTNSLSIFTNSSCYWWVRTGVSQCRKILICLSQMLESVYNTSSRLMFLRSVAALEWR